MSGITGLELRLVDGLATPAGQAGLFGLDLGLVDAPGTPNFAAGITGMALGIVVRSLTVRVYKLAGGAYVPLGNYSVSLTLRDTTDTQAGSTDAAGQVRFEFSDVNLIADLNPAQVPAGHSAELHYPLRAGFQNEVTVTFVSNQPARVYPFTQIL